MGNSFSCKYKNYLSNGNFAQPNIDNNSAKRYTGNQVPGWKFNTGVLINNSNTWEYPIPYPCGSQACSIQGDSSISQTFSVPKPGIYTLIIHYVARTCCDKSSSGNTLNIFLNEKQIGTLDKHNTQKWNFMMMELNLNSQSSNKLEIIGTAKTDRSTAIQVIITDCIQSKLPSSMLKINEKLNVGESKYSDNGEYFMTLKSDGNLCIYDDKKQQIWCSGKNSSSKPYVIFQADGNLCVHQIIENKKRNIWCAMSQGPNRTHVSLDNDGVIRVWDKSNNIVWSSNNSPDVTIDPVPSSQPSNMDYNYSENVAPIYVLGNYGIAPWGKNNDFIDDMAQWIWYTEKANIKTLNNKDSPVSIQYIYSNKSGIEIDANLNIIIDNECDVFLNSKQIKRNNGSLVAEDGWRQGMNAWNIFPCKIQPGENLFEFKVRNIGSPGGLLVSATTIGMGPQNSKVLFHTDNNWKFIPISPTPVQSCNLSQSGLISTIDKSFPWGCLTLNGTSTQYVNIGKTITGMKGLSFGCWFRSDNNKNFARILDFGNGPSNNNICLYVHGNKIGFSLFTMDKITMKDKLNLSPNINDNKWHHIIMTIKPNQQTGSTCTVYLNNNIVSTFDYVYPINMERTNCYIGKSNFNNPFFSGALSNFVMYQKVLSDMEVNALYMSMINLNDPALYIYLPFSTNSVLDTLLNNYAGKTFSLPVTKSKVENENWTCVEEEKNKWIGVKMENSKPICMSMDGKNCIEEESEKACNTRISNPVVPSNPIICGESKMNLGWCGIAENQLKQLTPSTPSTSSTELDKKKKISIDFNLEGVSIDDIKPGMSSLSALETNVEDKLLNSKPLLGGGQILSLTNMNDVNKLMIGGTFKLRVNLPNMPPYIKGKTFDINKGVEPNYFYLSVEKLDNNCNIKAPNDRCVQSFADDKKCNIKALTSYTQSNTYRLVLVSSQYVLDPSIPLGKNSDFTLVKVNNQMYLKNVQTGYLPSLYSNEMELPVYGDMEIKSNSNVNKIYYELNNTLCDQQIQPIQTTGTTFVKCNIKKDDGLYLITTKNIGTSSPVRINLNSDKTISLNVLSFNSYGYPTKVYTLTSCNFNVKTYAYIEKMTNNLGTFMVNMVCFEDTQNSKSNPKNQLKFTVELINFPKEFIKDNSVFDIN